MSTTFFHALEIKLLDPAVRGSREAVSALLSDDFVEVASNGRIYGKPTILDLRVAEVATGVPDHQISDFSLRMIAPEIALVTYHSTTPERRSIRFSLWKQTGGEWRMVFHQGTITT
jgi:hypothetical protein